MKQTTIQFSLVLFAVTLLQSIYTAWFHSNPLADAALNGIVAGILVSAAGSTAYMLGVARHGTWPSFKSTLFHAVFTYFFSYTVCNLFGLFAVSWFIFVGVVAVVGFLCGWRLAAPREAEATANQ